MQTMVLAFLLTALPVCLVAQQPRSPTKHSPSWGPRGDHVMFSHDATTDPKDKASIEQIRMHLSPIVSMFSNGKFNAPMPIHDTNSPGVATMIRL